VGVKYLTIHNSYLSHPLNPLPSGEGNLTFCGFIKFQEKRPARARELTGWGVLEEVINKVYGSGWGVAAGLKQAAIRGGDERSNPSERGRRG